MDNRFNVAPDIRVRIGQIGADLRVRGWDKDEVRASGEMLRVSDYEDGKSVLINAGGDCEIALPYGASLFIENVGADAKITEVHGEVHIDHVGADLSLRDVGPVTIESIGADARIRQVHGSVTIENIGADATLHDIEGDVKVRHIGADALVRQVAGGCICEFIGGDLIWQIAFAPGHEYRASTGSDTVIRLPHDANVTFTVDVEGDLENDADGSEFKAGTRPNQIVFGMGEAAAQIETQGDLHFVDDDGKDIRFDAAFDFDIDKIMEHATRATEQARRHMKREAERLQEEFRKQAERSAEQARREAERASRGRGAWSWSWGESKMKRPPTPPTPPRPPAPPRGATPPGMENEPVTNDERLTILKMVEAKQITVEEAEMLLAALEGK